MEGCMSGLMGNAPVTLCEGLTQLKSEHVPLLEKLHGLFSICTKIENGESTQFSQLRPAVENFIAELGPHSEREEEVLFKMMEAYLGRGMGPIAVMEYEHKQAKSLIGSFLEKTAGNVEIVEVEMMKEYSRLIKNAYHTLVDHFAKEENVLFPMAERVLSDEEKTELVEKINQI
jgi:regulator of cell morphogenesis and NO signaling